MPITKRWALYEKKNNIKAGCFEVTNSYIKCTLCSTVFKQRDVDDRYKYARDHKRADGHKMKYKDFCTEMRQEEASNFDALNCNSTELEER